MIFFFLWVFFSETNQNRRKARYRRASKRRRRTRGKAKLVEVLFSQKREALCFFELEQSITAVDSIAGKQDDSNSKRRRERERESERGRGWVVLQAFGLEDSKTEEEEEGCGSPVVGRVTKTTRGLERGLGLCDLGYFQNFVTDCMDFRAWVGWFQKSDLQRPVTARMITSSLDFGIYSMRNVNEFLSDFLSFYVNFRIKIIV